MIRVVLPYHLRTLAQVDGEVHLNLKPPVTAHHILSALEDTYPPLRGAIRDQHSLQRRPFLRFFVNGEDISHQDPSTPLSCEITNGQEPFIVLGAIAGG